jgi:hypothetical protein
MFCHEVGTVVSLMFIAAASSCSGRRSGPEQLPSEPTTMVGGESAQPTLISPADCHFCRNEVPVPPPELPPPELPPPSFDPAKPARPPTMMATITTITSCLFWFTPISSFDRTPATLGGRLTDHLPMSQ